MKQKKDFDRKLTPAGRIIISVVFYLFALLVACWKLWEFPTYYEYNDLCIFSISFIIASYYLLTYKSYKRKFYPDRKFSQPVSPDGSRLVDNSEYLSKQIFEETHKNPPLQQRRSFSIAFTMFAITVLYVLLDTDLFTSLPDTNVHPFVLPLAFISFGMMLTQIIIKEKKQAQLFAKVVLVSFIMVIVQILTIYLLLNYSEDDLVAVLSADLALIVFVYWISKYVKFIRNQK